MPQNFTSVGTGMATDRSALQGVLYIVR